MCGTVAHWCACVSLVSFCKQPTLHKRKSAHGFYDRTRFRTPRRLPAPQVLIGCVAAALLMNGAMPGWVAGVVVGRDVLLVAGSFVFRLRGFGWRWPGAAAFFRTVDTSAAAAGAATGAANGVASGGGGGGEGVSFMRPLLISKANTVLQLLLLGGYLLRGMDGGAGLQLLLPGGGGEELIMGLELATAATTVASGLAYGTMAVQGKLFK